MWRSVVSVSCSSVVDLHNQRFVLATEETTVTQQVSYRPIKCQSRSWSQRSTKANGPHHGDNSLVKQTGVHIVTKPLQNPTNRDIGNISTPRRCLWVRTTFSTVVSGVLPVFENHNYSTCYRETISHVMQKVF